MALRTFHADSYSYPDEYCCAISLMPMLNPVVLSQTQQMYAPCLSSCAELEYLLINYSSDKSRRGGNIIREY